MTDATFHLGQRLSYSGDLCTVRYIGGIDGTKGDWLGVEWDNVLRGKHSGEHNGRQYFECLIPSAGSFIRPSRAPDGAVSFLTALRKKYTTADDPKEPHVAISVSSSKVMEEVGFERMAEKLSHLQDLKIVLVDSLCIDRADDAASISATCPNIEELDLSRNLFENFAEVAKICVALPKLRTLRISGNRFFSIESFKPSPDEEPFRGVTSLELNNTLLRWDETTHLLSLFPSLSTLFYTNNSISSIPSTPPAPLTAIDLSHNNLTSLTSLLPLSSVPTLQRLVLSHNAISNLPLPESASFPHVTFIDLSYNAIPSFPALDSLPPAFPALANLRVSHNPLYDGVVSDEAHMLTIARLPESVKVVNHSSVTKKERENAEMWYLGKIAKELADAGEDGKIEVLARHRRWDELCQIHGPPAVGGKFGADDKTLASRLLELEFVGTDNRKEKPSAQAFAKRLPRSTHVSTVRGLVGRWFGMRPLHVQLQLDISGEGIKVLGEDDDAREIGNYVEESVARSKILVDAR